MDSQLPLDPRIHSLKKLTQCVCFNHWSINKKNPLNMNLITECQL